MLAVAAVASLAALDAVRGDGAGEPSRTTSESQPGALRGPLVPAPGAFAGALIVADGPDCRLRALDLEQLTLGDPGPATACRLWLGPDGAHAIATLPPPDDGVVPELWLVRLGDPPALVRRLGPSVSRPSWSRDGRLVAWCTEGLDSVVLTLATGAQRRVPGCYPEIEPGGRIVTRAGRGQEGGLLRDGVPEAALATARVFGQGRADDGTLALAVARPSEGFSLSATLELWRGGRRRALIPFPSLYGPAARFFGVRVELNPTATEAALVFPETLARPVGDDLAALVDLRSGQSADRIEGSRYRGHAWSPQGDWLALATGDEVRIYGSARDEPAYVLPVSGRLLGWSAGASTRPETG